MKVSALGDDAASARRPSRGSATPAGSCARSWPTGCACGRPRSWSSSSTAAPSTVDGSQNFWRASMGGMKAPEDLLRRIRQGNRFLLTSHINPDGDAIGSELGLARLLRRPRQGGRGVEPRHDAGDLPAAAGQRPHPRRRGAARRLPRRVRRHHRARSARAPTAPGSSGTSGAKPVINIDHHLGNQRYGPSTGSTRRPRRWARWSTGSPRG